MAKTFVEQTSAPNIDDLEYTNYKFGGYSICVKIDDKGHTLPNCVGYCHTQLKLMDDVNKTVSWNVPADNAHTWYEDAQKKGYQVGKLPKFGAIPCWGKGSNGNGHVAKVEKIWDNGNIQISESIAPSKENPNGVLWQTKILTKESGYAYGDKPFLGFVYPKIEQIGQIISATPTEDYFKSTTPERFKVVKDGKQINSYTTYRYAIADADKNSAVIIDSTTGKQIYPEVKESMPVETPKAKVVTGAKFNLNNTPVYSNQNGRADGTRTGTYFVWSDAQFNGYVRMTNKESRVGVLGQISFWCKAEDLERL